MTKANTVFISLDLFSDDPDIVRRALDAGAAVNIVNDEGETPIFHAVRTGNTDIVNMLILARAKLNVYNMADDTPLMVACEKGRAEIAKILLRHGANTCARNIHGFTPLHFACSTGDSDIVELLLQHGAEKEINARERSIDFSPLAFACAGGHVNIVRMLLNKGADIHSLGLDGLTVKRRVMDPKFYVSNRKELLFLFRAAAPGCIPDESLVDLMFKLQEDEPSRDQLLDWLQENHPELYFSKFCTLPIGP